MSDKKEETMKAEKVLKYLRNHIGSLSESLAIANVKIEEMAEDNENLIQQLKKSKEENEALIQQLDDKAE